jgi:hypothetical protein
VRPASRRAHAHACPCATASHIARVVASHYTPLPQSHSSARVTLVWGVLLRCAHALSYGNHLLIIGRELNSGMGVFPLFVANSLKLLMMVIFKSFVGALVVYTFQTPFMDFGSFWSAWLLTTWAWAAFTQWISIFCQNKQITAMLVLILWSFGLADLSFFWQQCAVTATTGYPDSAMVALCPRNSIRSPTMFTPPAWSGYGVTKYWFWVVRAARTPCAIAPLACTCPRYRLPCQLLQRAQRRVAQLAPPLARVRTLRAQALYTEEMQTYPAYVANMTVVNRTNYWMGIVNEKSELQNPDYQGLHNFAIAVLLVNVFFHHLFILWMLYGMQNYVKEQQRKDAEARKKCCNMLNPFRLCWPEDKPPQDVFQRGNSRQSRSAHMGRARRHFANVPCAQPAESSPRHANVRGWQCNAR